MNWFCRSYRREFTDETGASDETFRSQNTQAWSRPRCRQLDSHLFLPVMSTTRSLQQVSIGDSLPEREHAATNVSLFMYNAAIWNPHRIHYDETYTKNVEQHPDIVIDGPLQGDWLSQVALNWAGPGAVLVSFEYSNRRAAYLGERLTSGGQVTRVDPQSGEVELTLFIRNQENEIITPGAAVMRLPT